MHINNPLLLTVIERIIFNLEYLMKGFKPVLFIPPAATALIAVLLTVACSTEQTSNKTKINLTQKQTSALSDGKRLTEKAYDLKLIGQNSKALALFVKSHNILAKSMGKMSLPVASNLDDQAMIYLRTGNYARARKLFKNAQQILKTQASLDSRLAKGIERRLNTLKALEKHGVTCSEPLAPPPPVDAGVSPYFPVLEDVHKVFGLINSQLQGCVKGTPGPIAVRLVVTGNGLILEAQTRSPLKGTPSAKCIEKRILNAAPEFTRQLPRFRACFRNFTYPFIVGG